ncbi:MAG: galactoside O-acetyltransferase [Candidatus Methanoperedens nitroreducens]|uniref:Galactoside O-acetyltransferase n=1 Tax=Candidatus Methanoperedens nitratireducens TaxID=1392998 RepID=A0A0P8ADN3_9EURY|nr:MAG: galactoside O-acetyltransferase [Candidatus Methanoperedens sp. BLZ1]
MEIKREIILAFEVIIGNPLFNLPILRNIRIYVYKFFFNIEQNVKIDHNVIIIPIHKGENRFFIGKNTVIAHGCQIDCTGNLKIGRNCVISQETLIYTHEHLTKMQIRSEDSVIPTSLTIGDNVWIGARAIILPSVTTIGDGSIIGAGSVVTQNLGQYEIVAGNPARKIGERIFDPNLIE